MLWRVIIKALCHSLMDSVFPPLSGTSEKMCLRINGKWYECRLTTFREPLQCYRKDRPNASFDGGLTLRFSTEVADG